MVTTSAARLSMRRLFQAKYVMFAVYGIMMIIVWITRDHLLLVPGSPLRQHFAPVALLVFLHGFPAAVALFLGILQFSSRLRQRHLQVHRWMGRIYVGCVAVGAPVAVVVAAKLPVPTLLLESVIQSFGWLATTATALYCVRTGRIQQHREWMIRSYPFAMVFVVVRTILAIPAVDRMGVVGLSAAVWGSLAVACFLPSFLIEWQKFAASRGASRASTVMTA
jgi:uncharacterized membrane protein